MTDIEENLFNEYWRKLNEATDKGFGIPKKGTPDYDFYKELKSNNAVFAAFKTHRLQNDMAAQMLDEKGELKPFSRWVQDVMPIADHQNMNWFATEYNTCVKRAHQAAEWKQFEKEADILPNLRWMPSTAITPRASHMIFWNRVWSMADKFWNSHRPGDEWGCLCYLSSTDDPITDNADFGSNLTKHDPGLGGNPGITAQIFSDDHPYMAEAHKGAQKAVQNFLKGIVAPFKPYKSYKNGGEISVHNAIDKKKSDYKAVLTAGNQFAKAGHKVKLTPSLHFKSEEYKNIYDSLLGTKYERKCPDLQIGEHFYEFEGYVPPFKKEKIGRMISHGLKQSPYIIIDNTKGAADRFIRRSILSRIKQGLNIEEVWLYEKGNVRLFYKKQEST